MAAFPAHGVLRISSADHDHRLLADWLTEWIGSSDADDDLSVAGNAPAAGSRPFIPIGPVDGAPGGEDRTSDKPGGSLAGLLSSETAAALHGGAIDTTYSDRDAMPTNLDGPMRLAPLDPVLRDDSLLGGVASGAMPAARLAPAAAPSESGGVREDAHLAAAAKLPDQAAAAIRATNLTETTTDGHTVTIDGTGITIGILSDSFNTSGGADTMQTDIARGYLPTDTHILKDSPGGTDEGRAMAEIVHEIAPGAAILFATADGGQAAFAANIVALANAGAKVIVDDVGYYAEPAYQDGVIAQAIDYVTSQLGVAYFSAAGNDGSNGYEGAFTRGSRTALEVFDNFTPGNGQHDSIPVIVPAGDEVVFVLQWASPAASASAGHGASSELDLFLTRGFGGIVAQSRAHTIGRNPFQEIDYHNASSQAQTLHLEVGLSVGHAPQDFKLMALDDGGGAVLGSYASNHNQGTIYGHAAAAGAVAVGADFIGDTPAFGALQPSREYYSSTGPTGIYFDANGRALASPEMRPGPALMAPDGADTSFFGFQINDGDHLPNFFGTSAAAPAAAAVEALVMQADPLLTAGQATSLLESTALHQPGSVAGLVQAELAVNAAWDLYT